MSIERNPKLKFNNNRLVIPNCLSVNDLNWIDFGLWIGVFTQSG